MASADYNTIKKAMDDTTNTANKYAIQVTYKSSPRTFVPFVLGSSPEVVLGYQYIGPYPHPKGTGWRCFLLSDFQAGTATQIAFTPPAWWTPQTMKFKDVKRQSCVDENNVEVWQQKTI